MIPNILTSSVEYILKSENSQKYNVNLSFSILTSGVLQKLTIIFLEAASDWCPFDFLLEQVLLIQKQNDWRIDEPSGVANGFEDAHWLHHSILKRKMWFFTNFAISSPFRRPQRALHRIPTRQPQKWWSPRSRSSESTFCAPTVGHQRQTLWTSCLWWWMSARWRPLSESGSTVCHARRAGTWGCWCGQCCPGSWKWTLIITWIHLIITWIHQGDKKNWVFFWINREVYVKFQFFFNFLYHWISFISVIG